MPYRIFYLKPRLLIQPQNSRMKSPNQTEIAYQLSNLGSICTRLMSNFSIFVSSTDDQIILTNKTNNYG